VIRARLSRREEPDVGLRVADPAASRHHALIDGVLAEAARGRHLSAATTATAIALWGT
jgi:hypothetical protein